MRKPRALACGLDGKAGILIDQALVPGPEEVTAQGGKATIGRAGTGLRVAGGKPSLDVPGPRRIQGFVPRFREPAQEQREIATISCDSVGSEAILDPEGFEKRIQRGRNG